MAKIIRREFMGNWILFWLLCVTIFLIPIAILYLVTGTVTIEDEIENPEEFVRQYRAGKLGR